MADVGSLGQYKVVVTADYSQLQSQFKAMMDLVTNTTKAMTDTLNNSTKAMGQIMSTNIKTMVDSMNSAFSGADTAIKGFGQTAENAAKNVQSASQKIKNSGDGFKNYTKQIREAKAEMEKAFQKADELQTRYNLINNDSVHGRADLAYLKESKLADTARDLKEAKAEAERLRIQYDRLVEAQKRFKEYAGQTQIAQKEQIREAVAGANAQIKALDRQAKTNSQMLQGQMRAAQQVQDAERRTDRQREQNANRQQQRIAHLQTQYRVAYEEANKYLQTHAQMSEAVFIRLQGRLTAFSAQLQALGAMPAIANPLAGMNYQQYISGFSKLNDVLKSVKHHLMWMASAAVIGAGFGIPLGVSKAIEAFDALQTKIMQNMELANQYDGNTQKLHTDMNRMGEATKIMAQGFGVSLNEVQEGMQIITRRFKDADTAIYLTNVALQMSKLDMVDVKQSAKDLEAVMLQFGMGAKDAGKFLNDFSVICHVARISGTDMLMALERSGSAFKAMNMDARAAMAAIAAVSTVTGKSGATIGDSWKSILANMDFKKATAALEAYNIKLYEVGQNGAKTMRSGTAVLSEILATYQKLDDEGRRKLATAIAGGKYQVNNMMAFLADASGSFNTFLQQMNEKSSDAMTAQLLQASMDTYQTRLAQAKAAFEVLGVTIGEQVLPALKNMALLFTGLGQYLQQHAGAIVGIASACAKLAVGFLMVTAAMGTWTIMQGIATGVKAAITGVALAQGASAIAVMAHNAAVAIHNGLMVLATPLTMAWSYATSASGIASGIASGMVGLLIGSIVTLETVLAPVGVAMLALIAVIGALGTIAYVVYENWETVSNDLAYIWNMLVDVISAAIEAIILAFSPLFIAIYAIAEVVGWAIKNVIAPLFQWVAGVISAVISSINGWLTEHGVTTQNIANNIRFIWNNFVAWLANNISPAFAQWLSDMVDKLVAFAKKVWEIASSVKNAIRSMFGMAQNAGENGGGWIDNIANGIKSKLNFDLLNSIADAKAGMENSPYAQEHNMPTGAMPNGIPSGGGGAGSKGKGSKGSKGAKEADNSPEAMGYRYLMGKGLDKNMVLGILANIAHESSFNPDATNGNHWGMIQWDSDRWGRFLGEYLSMRGMSQSDYYASDVNTKRTLQYDYIVHEMTKGAERGSYQKILDAVPSTPEQWAHLINMHYERSGVYSGGTDWERQKSAREYATRFERKNGEDNYTDGEKAIENAYKQAKKLFDLELQKLKYEREMKGEKVTALDEKALYEKIMFVNGKNPYALLEQAQKDYQKQLLEAAKYEAKRQEDIRKSTDTQVKAIEKMADAEIAFAKKLGLLNDSDVRKYEWEKNESNYVKNKPLLDAKLGSTVDMSKGTADDMLAAYQGYVNAKTDLDAKYYAEKMFNLSRDVDATMKALNEVYKLEQSYYEKRKKINDEEFLYKSRYATTFIDSLTNGIQSGLEGILNRTKSFAEAFRDIFKGLVQDIIKLFSQDFAERIKKWLSNAILKPKATGNKAGAYEDIVGMKSAGGKSIGGDNNSFNLIGWAQNSLSSLGGGTGKGKGVGQNPLVKALGGYSFASEMRKAVQPGMIALRNTTQMTINGMSNITQQGMQTISGGIQTGTQAMTMTWQGMEVSKQMATEMGNAGIVANSQATAATVQATTAQMMGWIMAVLALFSLFGGGGGSSTTESHDSVNLGRSPDSYYMTPTPVLQSTTFNVPSFDIGGNIEQDMFAMVHKNEMVLTPEQANVIRETAKNGGSLGGSMSGSNANIKSNIQVSTVDSRGFERVLRDYNRDLSKSVKKGIRNGYLTAKGLM